MKQRKKIPVMLVLPIVDKLVGYTWVTHHRELPQTWETVFQNISEILQFLNLILVKQKKGGMVRSLNVQEFNEEMGNQRTLLWQRDSVSNLLPFTLLNDSSVRSL
jgi:hypothetical protein